MPDNRRNLGYVDLATPRKQSVNNPKIQHAETVVRKMNFLLNQTQDLIERVDRIYQNEKLSNNDKSKNSASTVRTIEKNIEEMKNAINDERRAIYEEFTRIRKLNPNVPLDQHPELKSLKAASEKLAAFAETIKNTRPLVMTPTPSAIDPTFGSMPLIPITKPIIDKEQMDAFVNLAIDTKSWSSVDRKITEFARNAKVNIREVREQVLEALLEKRMENVFGRKPRDVANPQNKSDDVEDKSTFTPRRPGGR